MVAVEGLKGIDERNEEAGQRLQSPWKDGEWSVSRRWQQGPGLGGINEMVCTSKRKVGK